jgi:SAM-dependent methyltransferase
MRLETLLRQIFNRPEPLPPEGMIGLSTPAIHQAILCAIDRAAPTGLSGDYLDIGSGMGDLVRLVRARFSVKSFACDYTQELMRLPGQAVEIVDLNQDPLPYPDGRFALVTCAETIEHLEHYRETLRQIYRVLKPGGLAVITTPNVLNLRSRVHNLTFGFASLFGPLATGEQDVHKPAGHINPVAWPYLAHALSDAGFIDIELTVDRYQRRSLISLFYLYLPIRFAGWYAYRRELKKYRTITAENERAIRKINSRDILLGRTLIVAARKPE